MSTLRSTILQADIDPETVKELAGTAQAMAAVLGPNFTFLILLIVILGLLVAGCLWFYVTYWKESDAVTNLRYGLEFAVQRAADDAREHKILYHVKCSGLSMEQAENLFRRAIYATPSESVKHNE